MSNKKGVAVPILGTVLIVIGIIGFAYLGTLGGEFLRSTNVKAFKAISLTSFEESLRKMVEESLDIIAKRNAYDLGKLGGLKGTDTAVWTGTYPQIKDLKAMLEDEIKENLPSYEIKNNIRVEWGNNSIDIDITSNTNFLIIGSSNFSVRDETIDSTIKINLIFNNIVNSSYFKLLDIGRKIFEDAVYYNLLISDIASLETRIETDFNIEASIKDSGEYWNVSLKDVNCLLTDEFYCIAPLRAGEGKLVNWEGVDIPYDYLQLNFRIKKGTPPAV